MDVKSGTRFGDLTVINEVERSGYNRRFLCRCVCGRESIKFLGNLRLGRSTSCGCLSVMGEAGRKAVIAQRRAVSEESEHGRICLTCQRWQPWDRFSRDDRRTSGKSSNCLDCAHWRSVRSWSSLTREEWEWLHESQQRRCALCDEYCFANLCVDHDHSCCGKVKACKKCIRGMLCRTCNRMLGHVETKPRLRVRFAYYLSRRPFLSVPTGGAEPVLEDVM